MKTVWLNGSMLFLFGVLLYVPLDAVAESYEISFVATVDRVILPTGEALAIETIVGASVTGLLVLSDIEALRDTEPAAGKGNTFWQKSTKELTIEGAVAAGFRGGNLFVQDGQINLSATSQYCLRCSANGPPVETVATGNHDGARSKTYYPARYLLIQSAPYHGADADFGETVANIQAFSDENPVKAMLFYSEAGSDEEPLKFILTLRNLSVNQ